MDREAPVDDVTGWPLPHRSMPTTRTSSPSERPGRRQPGHPEADHDDIGMLRHLDVVRHGYAPNKTCENGNGLWLVFPVSVISIWSSSFTPSRAPTSPQYTSRQSTMPGSITRSPFG